MNKNRPDLRDPRPPRSAAMNQDPQTVEHLMALELSLLEPSVRSNAPQVAELLSSDFLEFGSSGRIWSRDATVAGLASEKPRSNDTLGVSDMAVRLLAEGAALVTYSVKRLAPGEPEVRTLRSSIWCRENGKWRMKFHQGTLVPSEVTP